MPSLTARKSDEVPPKAASSGSRAMRELRAQYDSYIHGVPEGSVGELELMSGETTRSVKTHLRRASSRMSVKLDVWDADGRVYFNAAAPARRRVGRPRKVTG